MKYHELSKKWNGDNIWRQITTENKEHRRTNAPGAMHIGRIGSEPDLALFWVYLAKTFSDFIHFFEHIQKSCKFFNENILENNVY